MERNKEIVPKEAIEQFGETMTKAIYTQDAVDFVKKEYIKQNWKGTIRNIGCMVATLVQVHNDPNCPYVVAIGVSVCNMQHDTFDKRIATDIALGRAKQHHKEYKLKDKRLRHYDGYPIWLSDEINAFILSCIKYYKDKSILHPKIVFV